jgi:glutamyl-tRNA synthetase
VAESVGRKLGKAQAPIRIAVTGRRVGPPLFEALEALGRERTLDRLRTALELVTSGRTPTS